MPTHFDPDKNPEDDRFQPKPGDSHDRADGEEKDPRDNSDLADKEESSGEGGGFYKPEGDKAERGALDKTKPTEDGGNTSLGWVRGDSTSKNIRRFVGNSFMRKKTLALGGGTAGGTIILIFVFFSFFSTYKVTHIIENIEQQVGKVPQYAIERRLEYHLQRYLISRQLVKAGIPEADIDKDYIHLGNSPLRAMYTNWKGAKLESILEDEYGVRLKAKTSGINGWKQFTNPVDWEMELTGAGKHSNLRGQKLSSKETRQFLRMFADEELKTKSVIKRYHTRKVLFKYYGVDGWKHYAREKSPKYEKYDDWIIEKKKNFKKTVNKYTVKKMNASWGAYIDCMLEGEGKAVCKETRKANNSGEKLAGESELDDLAKKVEKEVAEETAEEVIEETEKALAKKMTSTVSKFGVKRFATYAVPIAGQVMAAGKIVQAVDDGRLSQVVYAKNAAQYAGFTAPFLSTADQVRSNLDIDAAGARILTDTFKNYEQSLVHQSTTKKKLQSGKKIKQDCNDDGDTTDAEDYVYEDNPVCEGKKVLQDKESFTNTEGWQVISNLRYVVDNPVVELFNTVVDKTLDYSGVNDIMAKAIELSGVEGAIASGVEYLISRIAAPVITGYEVGPQAYDALFAGIAVTNSSLGGGVGEAREDTIGGAYLSNQQVAQIKEEDYDQRQYELGRESTIARYFSPEVPESLTSQAIMATPSSATSAASMFGSLLSPSRYFDSTISNFTADAKAQASQVKNPFGVINYGFPADHEIFTSNGGSGMEPDVLQKKYQCNKPAADRPQNDLDDYDDFGGTLPFPVATEVDPCLLEDATADAGTRWLAKTYDEGLESGATASGGGTTGVAVPGGFAWPMPHQGSVVTSCYGMRDMGFHRGTDISTGAGTAPISAIADGEVVFAGPADGYGPNYVVIKHANNVHSSYGHMRSMSVTLGQQVKQAEQIGVEGNEGESYGAHLHLNLYKDADTSYNSGVDILANGLEVPEGVPVTGGNCGAHR